MLVRSGDGDDQCLRHQGIDRTPLGDRASLEPSVEVVVDASDELPHAPA
jgi:hypothetical protein